MCYKETQKELEYLRKWQKENIPDIFIYSHFGSERLMPERKVFIETAFSQLRIDIVIQHQYDTSSGLNKDCTTTRLREISPV